jgi:hypothetical protein
VTSSSWLVRTQGAPTNPQMIGPAMDMRFWLEQAEAEMKVSG